MAFINARPVGYGDLVALTLNSKGDWVFAGFYTIISVITFTACLGNIVIAVAEIRLERKAEKLAREGLTSDMITAMDETGNSKVSRFVWPNMN